MSKKLQTHLLVLVPGLVFYAKMQVPQQRGRYLNVILYYIMMYLCIYITFIYLLYNINII